MIVTIFYGVLIFACSASPAVATLTNTTTPDINPTNAAPKEILAEAPTATEEENLDYPSGEIVLHEADGNIVYNYWSYVPKSINRSDEAYILLEVSHAQIEDYIELTSQAKNNISRFVEISEKEKVNNFNSRNSKRFYKWILPPRN